MPEVRNAKTVSVSIKCPGELVYAFVSNPENLPKWATAFAHSVKKVGNDWVVETPDGPMGIRFVEQNDFGVLDHYVILPSGQEVLNPMRVVRNGSGSELMFTVFQVPDASNQKFAEDAAMVERDLRSLKSLLELQCQAS